jgi:lipopolysaccharide transport system ATP-binding protein
LGQGFDGNRGLRHVLNDLFTKPFRRSASKAEKPCKEPGSDEFWALRDISFELKQGETLGIIGRNGAGKSTLLKILSRITEPTTGEIEITGRVASLLEVGTGFHGDLSGRENIFLNGAILGMPRAEIKRKFDEIVAFAEIEQFIDTPVKRYSSGMYVRLAFAVAAHLEPEILIVDEVLAVGDTAFQKKCIGKMGEVSRGGRTVLFVSHNLAVVQMLCSRTILLQSGELVFDSTPAQTVSAYLNSLEQSGKNNLTDRTDRRGKAAVRLCSVEIINPNALQSGRMTVGGPAKLIFRFDRVVKGMAFGFTLYDQAGQAIANFSTSCRGTEDTAEVSSEPLYLWETEEVILLPGRYRINSVIFAEGELQDHVEGAVSFEVDEGNLRGRAIIHNYGYGSVCFPHRWHLAEPMERGGGAA